MPRPTFAASLPNHLPVPLLVYRVPRGEPGVEASWSLLTSSSQPFLSSRSQSFLCSFHAGQSPWEKLSHGSTHGQRDGTSFEAAATLPACAAHGKSQLRQVWCEELALGQEWSSPAPLPSLADGFQLHSGTSHANCFL